MGESVSLWTRITHRANVLVWKTPLPERLRSRLSAVVYINPPMTSVRVVETLEAIAAAGLKSYVMGGWGLSALAGKQIRTHRDLDIVVDQEDVEAVLSVLSGLGYEEWYRHLSPDSAVGRLFSGLPGENVVVRDEGMRVVDIQGLAVRDCGESFVVGTIGGLRVRCLTAEQHLFALQGSGERLPRERRRNRNHRTSVQMAHRLASAGSATVADATD